MLQYSIFLLDSEYGPNCTGVALRLVIFAIFQVGVQFFTTDRFEICAMITLHA